MHPSVFHYVLRKDLAKWTLIVNVFVDHKIEYQLVTG